MLEVPSSPEYVLKCSTFHNSFLQLLFTIVRNGSDFFLTRTYCKKVRLAKILYLGGKFVKAILNPFNLPLLTNELKEYIHRIVSEEQVSKVVFLV